MAAQPATPVQLLFTPLESELLKEVQALRRDPPAYATLLEQERLPMYEADGTTLKVDDETFTRTREGKAACEAAIAFLRSQPANTLSEVVPSYGMSLAARDAVATQGASGTVGNVTADGKELPTSLDLMDDRGYVTGNSAEVCGYGGRNGRAMVFSFIIGDGDQSRTYRRVLLDPRWGAIGIGAGEHKSDYKVMAVLNFAEKYRDRA